MIWIGLIIILAGLSYWAFTVWRFWDLFRYGGIDMSSASAFDLQWTKGAVVLAVGVGLTWQSWPVSVVVGILGALSSMAAKPLFAKAAGWAAVGEKTIPVTAKSRSGFADYLKNEKEIVDKNDPEEPDDER